MGSIESNICEAIDIIVNRAIEQATFDKTIQATIVSLEDKSTGKYKVRYQGNLFYAYSNDIDTTYNTGTYVYVLVPGNNMKNTKTIIGSVNRLGTEYIRTDLNKAETFVYIGTNGIISNKTFGLRSYLDGGDNLVLYDVTAASNYISIDEESLKEYFKAASYLIIGANFQTKLNKEQQLRGTYGILLEVDYIDSSDPSNTITRKYAFDSSQMNGTPYSFEIPTRQFATYEADGIHYERVRKISLYSQNFPFSLPSVFPEGDKPTYKGRDISEYKNSNYENGELQPDIFITLPEFGAIKYLTESELNNSALIINTPKGAMFKEDATLEDSIDLEAEVRIKGKTVQRDDSKLEYYWFIKDTSILSDNYKYSQYAGEGWRCLNDFYNIYDETLGEDKYLLWNDNNGESTAEIDWNEDENDIYWNSGAEEKEASKVIKWCTDSNYYKQVIYNKDIWGQSQTYKCVVVYDGEVLSQEITIKNNASNNKLEIISDSGVDFYYDAGSPTLTCLLTGEEQKNGYSYYWGLYDNNNKYFSLPYDYTKTSQLIQIETRIKEIEILKVTEQVLDSAVDIEYKDLKLQRESILTGLISLNKVYRYPVSRITNFSTFSCSVYSDKLGFLGTAELKINNFKNKELSYGIELENGDKIFNYDANGVSPATDGATSKITLLPLIPIVYDNKGNNITKRVLIDKEDMYWEVPAKDTLITINDSLYEVPEITENGTYIYRFKDGTEYINEFTFGIAKSYSVNKDNNTISLVIKYQGMTLRGNTRFTFLKDGENGTNGSDYSCKIIPNAIDMSKAPNDIIIYQYGIEDVESPDPALKGWYLNYPCVESHKWFNVEIFREGENVFTGNKNGKLIDGTPVTIEWSVLKNKYSYVTNYEYLKDAAETELHQVEAKKTDCDKILKDLQDDKIFYYNNKEISKIENITYEDLISEATYIDLKDKNNYTKISGSIKNTLLEAESNFLINYNKDITILQDRINIYNQEIAEYSKKDMDTDYTNISYTIAAGFLYHPDEWFDTAPERAAANIVQAKVSIGGKSLYVTIPVYKVMVNNSNYTITLKENTGFKYVTYKEDGTSPSYKTNSPFELSIVDKLGNEYNQKVNEQAFTYEWYSCGEILTYVENPKYPNRIVGKWENTNLLVLKEKEGLVVSAKEAIVKTDLIYNGYSKNNGIYCIIKDKNDNLVGRIEMPVHFMLNRYGLSELNGWNGNDIEINEEDGYILAPKVGAGKKENDNSFTGVYMGTAIDSSKSKTGLIGYSHGKQSILLNSEDGSATFGIAGGSQIILEPGNESSGSAETAIIKSGNYISKADGSGKGMAIDLAKPEIRFGSGNFIVNKNGHVTAKGGGSIAGWEISDWKLSKATSEKRYTGISIDNRERDENGSIIIDPITGNEIYNDAQTFAFYAGAADNNPYVKAVRTRLPNFAVSFDGTMYSQRAEIGGGNIPIIIGKDKSGKNSSIY